MKYLILLLFGWSAIGAEMITGTITVTNEAGTTNGQTVTINGDVRTWTTNATLSSEIATNSTIGGSASNMFNAFARYPLASLSLARSGTNAVTLQTAPGGSLAVTLSDGWGTISYATNQITNAFLVRVPYTVEKAEGQTNITSGLAAALNSAANTNALLQGAKVAENLMGLTNDQTVAGAKLMTNAAGQWRGVISNSPAISGTLFGITNGYATNTTLENPVVVSNLWFGTGSLTSGMQISFALGEGPLRFTGEGGWVALEVPWSDGTPVLIPSGVVVTNYYWGDGAYLTNVSARYVNPGSTVSNLTVNGATLSGTNTVSGQLAFTRKANTSLANGNNAAVDVSTNVFIEVSGPSSAFVINGIAGGTDGRTIVLLNRTGYAMTLANNSGVDPTAGNRIYTATGQDKSTVGNGSATLIYSAADSRWHLISMENESGVSGSFAFMSITTAHAIVVDTGTYHAVTNYDSATAINFSTDTAAGSVTNSIAGYYHIAADCSFIGGNADAFEAEVFTNGVAVDAISFKRTFTASASIAEASCQGILYLPVGTRVDFRINNQTDGDDPTIHRMQLNVSSK